MARKSGSLNLKGIFDTCNLFGWPFELSTAAVIDVAIVDTDVVIGAIVANAAADDTGKFAPDDDIIDTSNDCCPVSGSVCCNKSGWAECMDWHYIYVFFFFFYKLYK